MAGQTIETVITVDAKQAQAEIDRFKSSMMSAEGAINRAGASLPAMEKATGNAANKMLILGQFVDDAQYGLRGVVNNMPQVAQAFGGTAGLAGAVGIAAVAVSQLYDAYKAVDAIQKEAAANSTIWRDALESTHKTLRDGSLKSTNDLVQALKDAQEEIKNFGKTSTEVSIMTAQETIAATEKSLSILEKNLPGMEERAKPQGRKQLSFLQQLGVTEVFTEQEKEDFKMQNGIVETAKKRREELTEELKRQKAALEGLKSANQELGKLEAQKSAKDVAGKTRDQHAKDIEDSIRAEIEMREKFDRLEAKAEEQRAKDMEEAVRAEIETRDKIEEIEAKAEERAQREREKAQREREKAEEKHLSRLHDLQGNSLAERLAFDDIAAERQMANLDKLRDHEWKALKDRVEAQRDFYNEIGGMATKSTELAIGLGQDYVNAKIEGAENAEAEVAAQFLKGIGNQLVGIGTKNLIEGAGMSIASGGLDPRGPALMGLGGLAIATGIAMGAGGTAIAHTAAGGQIGKPLPDRESATDRGASPRSSRGGGDGGPLVINISYGVGGPLPEDTAREIARVQRTGNRRSGA